MAKETQFGNMYMCMAGYLVKFWSYYLLKI